MGEVIKVDFGAKETETETEFDYYTYDLDSVKLETDFDKHMYEKFGDDYKKMKISLKNLNNI